MKKIKSKLLLLSLTSAVIPVVLLASCGTQTSETEETNITISVNVTKMQDAIKSNGTISNLETLNTWLSKSENQIELISFFNINNDKSVESVKAIATLSTDSKNWIIDSTITVKTGYTIVGESTFKTPIDIKDTTSVVPLNITLASQWLEFVDNIKVELTANPSFDAYSAVKEFYPANNTEFVTTTLSGEVLDSKNTTLNWSKQYGGINNQEFYVTFNVKPGYSLNNLKTFSSVNEQQDYLKDMLPGDWFIYDNFLPGTDQPIWHVPVGLPNEDFRYAFYIKFQNYPFTKTR
ncbi:MAG: hypothetical protein KFW07_02665 [Mycoplasmataceae bacterium]|nr:hypothetical protein [Mycoplasmataceae bacterium]